MEESHGKTSFEQAGQRVEPGLVAEFYQMLRENKKYWMIPLVLLLLFFGLVILLGSTAAGAFIYPLF